MLVENINDGSDGSTISDQLISRKINCLFNGPKGSTLLSEERGIMAK